MERAAAAAFHISPTHLRRTDCSQHSFVERRWIDDLTVSAAAHSCLPGFAFLFSTGWMEQEKLTYLYNMYLIFVWNAMRERERERAKVIKGRGGKKGNNVTVGTVRWREIASNSAPSAYVVCL